MDLRPICLSKKAIEDIKRLRKENVKLAAKLLDLILDIQRNPFDGIGEPELLKHLEGGWWSRRIDLKHRLIYRIKENNLEIASCYGHYGDK